MHGSNVCTGVYACERVGAQWWSKGHPWLFNSVSHFLSPHVGETVAAPSPPFSRVTPLSLGDARASIRRPGVWLGWAASGSGARMAFLPGPPDGPGCLRSFPPPPFISLNWADQSCQERGPGWKASALRQSVIASLWDPDINRFPERRQFSSPRSLPLFLLPTHRDGGGGVRGKIPPTTRFAN